VGERARAFAVTLFGLGLLTVGGRLVVYEYLLAADGKTALAEITDTGSVRRSAGGYVDFVRYRFVDRTGTTRSGSANGYTGTIGETILVEYSAAIPAIHRVSGAGTGPGYAWRWALVAAGSVFVFGGGRWLLMLRAPRF